MALVLPRTKQLPTQQLRGYTDVLNNVMTTDAGELQKGYRSVIKTEDASIGNTKPVRLSLSKVEDPDAPTIKSFRFNVSSKPETTGIGSTIRMTNSQDDFFKKMDSDMYQYRLVPNGEMVDAWHENKGDRFGRDKDTTKRIFKERLTNQFSDITGEDRYMEEDTYEPVRARPPIGLPSASSGGGSGGGGGGDDDRGGDGGGAGGAATRTSLATRDRRSRAVAIANSGIGDDRFDRFLDEIVGVPRARARRQVVNEIEQAAGETVASRDRRIRATSNMNGLGRAALREQRHLDAQIQAEDDARSSRARSNMRRLGGAALRQQRRSAAVDEAADDLEGGRRGRRSSPGDLENGFGGESSTPSTPSSTPLSTPSSSRSSTSSSGSSSSSSSYATQARSRSSSSSSSPSPSFPSSEREAMRQLFAAMENSINRLEEYTRSPVPRTPRRTATPAATPTRRLSLSPEAGGGGGGGSADDEREIVRKRAGEALEQFQRTAARTLTGAIIAIGNAPDLESLNRLGTAVRNRDATALQAMPGIGPNYAAALLSDNPRNRQRVMDAIAQLRSDMAETGGAAQQTEGASPRREDMIRDIIDRGIPHHRTGRPYTFDQLKLMNARGLQAILSRR